MPRVSTSTHPIAVFRRANGLTQTEMAELLDLKMRTVLAIECGKRRMTAPTEAKLAMLRDSGGFSEAGKALEQAVTKYRADLYKKAGIPLPSA